MPSKTIDKRFKYLISEFGLISHISKEGINEGHYSFKKTKQQLLQDLTEMSEIYPEKGIGSLEPVRAVPLSRLIKYLNIEGDDEKAKE